MHEQPDLSDLVEGLEEPIEQLAQTAYKRGQFDTDVASEAYQKGRQEGLSIGRNEGHNDAIAEVAKQESYNRGHVSGKAYGYEQGKREAQVQADDALYSKGYKQGQNDAKSIWENADRERTELKNTLKQVNDTNATLKAEVLVLRAELGAGKRYSYAEHSRATKELQGQVKDSQVYANKLEGANRELAEKLTQAQAYNKELLGKLDEMAKIRQNEPINNPITNFKVHVADRDRGTLYNSARDEASEWITMKQYERQCQNWRQEIDTLRTFGCTGTATRGRAFGKDWVLEKEHERIVTSLTTYLRDMTSAWELSRKQHKDTIELLSKKEDDLRALKSVCRDLVRLLARATG